MNNNLARLRRNNETALTIVAIVTIMRLIISAVAAGNASSKGINTFQIVLCVLLFIGCIAVYKIMDDSEAAKLIAFGGAIFVYAIALFNYSGVYNVLPFCVLMVATLIYLDERFSVLVASSSAILMLIRSIMMFISGNKAGGGEWLISTILFLVMSFSLYKTATAVIRIQETDRQEIQYHLMYQEEITQNMVNVVDSGNEHIGALQVMLDSFHQATDEVNHSVEAISNGVTETAYSIENQTEMTANIQSVINELIHVKDDTLSSVSQAVDATENGGKLVTELKNKSDDIAATNQDVTRVAKELQDKIYSAEEITQFIYQISTQTNLLALNASIEAARAGEAGRGFSVVADEIRNLADNTKQSIDNITELLQGITLLAEETANLVNNSVKASEAQAEYIGEVTTAFETIANMVDTLSGNMQSLDSLSTNLDESNNAIIDSLTTQQAASEEMAANAQSSASLSEQNLDELVNVIGELDQIAEIIGSLKLGEDI